MAKSKAEVNFMEHLKPLLPAGGDASELEVAAQALAGLSPEDRDLLAAVQESPYRLTTLEQFREFPANTEYFVLEPNIRKVEDVGWRYLAQHLDVLLPPELLDAIDPVPFGNHAMQEEQGCFTSRGYATNRTCSFYLTNEVDTFPDPLRKDLLCHPRLFSVICDLQAQSDIAFWKLRLHNITS